MLFIRLFVFNSTENPLCEDVGCGKWEKPTIPNPDYKGKWKRPMVDNPNYKGEWKPRRIANPDYFEDMEPFRMTPIVSPNCQLRSQGKFESQGHFILAKTDLK